MELLRDPYRGRGTGLLPFSGCGKGAWCDTEDFGDDNGKLSTDLLESGEVMSDPEIMWQQLGPCCHDGRLGADERGCLASRGHKFGRSILGSQFIAQRRMQMSEGVVRWLEV